jgi:hypothetical protein
MSEVDSELGTFALKLTQCSAVRNYYPIIRSISQQWLLQDFHLFTCIEINPIIGLTIIVN